MAQGVPLIMHLPPNLNDSPTFATQKCGTPGPRDASMKATWVENRRSMAQHGAATGHAVPRLWHTRNPRGSHLTIARRRQCEIYQRCGMVANGRPSHWSVFCTWFIKKRVDHSALLPQWSQINNDDRTPSCQIGPRKARVMGGSKQRLGVARMHLHDLREDKSKIQCFRQTLQGGATQL